MERFAGIDVSLKDSSVCVVDATGRIVREAKVASEPAKGGDANGPGLPGWLAYQAQSDGAVMRFTAQPGTGPDPRIGRYGVLNRFYFGRAQ
jgi:hypothetical protein